MRVFLYALFSDAAALQQDIVFQTLRAVTNGFINAQKNLMLDAYVVKKVVYPPSAVTHCMDTYTINWLLAISSLQKDLRASALKWIHYQPITSRAADFYARISIKIHSDN